MRLLLDSATLLWFYHDPKKLTSIALQAMTDGANSCLVSPATYWEIAIKVSKGQLQLLDPFGGFIKRAIRDNSFRILPIRPSHAERIVSLPFHHKDPFDRILVAQAMVEGIALVSPDQVLDQYGVNRLW